MGMMIECLGCLCVSSLLRCTLCCEGFTHASSVFCLSVLSFRVGMKLLFPLAC